MFYLQTLSFKDYRCFKDAIIQFEPGINIIFGENGTGKTSVLKAANIILGALISNFDYGFAPQIHTNDVHEDAAGGFELPAAIDAQLRIENIDYRIRRRTGEHKLKSGKVSETVSRAIAPCNMAIVPYQYRLEQLAKIQFGIFDRMTELRDLARSPETKDKTTLPVFSYYSTQRVWVEKNDTNDVVKDGDRFKGYKACTESKANTALFERWFKTQELTYFKTKEEPAGYTLINKTLQSAIPGFIKMEWHANKDELVLFFKNDNTSQPRILFSQLSDGYRNMVATVADIAFRCFVLNPHLGVHAAKETEGIVLIDEVELHLHPRWQRAVVAAFANSFPKIQFILTTHSPQVLSSVQNGNLIFLRPDFSIEYIDKLYGKDTNSILEQYMGTDERPAEVKEQLETLLQLIEDGNANSSQTAELENELKDTLGATDPDVVRAEVRKFFLAGKV